MYPSYGGSGSYQRPASPVLIPKSGIQGLRSGNPIFVVPYGQQRGASSRADTAVVDTQQRYYELRKLETPQVQNPYGGQAPANGRSPRLSTSDEQAHAQAQWQPPVIRNPQAWPVQIVNSQDDNTAYCRRARRQDGDDEDGYEMIDFYESLSEFPFYERSAYAMFYSREATASPHQAVNILMILGAGGEFCFPGGHIEQTDQSVVDGLNRELREEINVKRKFLLNQSDYLLTFVRHRPPFIEHFYVREVSPSELLEMEKRVPGGARWGIEIFGVLRVPLSVSEDGFRGFPAFLSNMFMHNARTLLLEGIRQRQLMHQKQLKELIQASDKYLRDKLNTLDSNRRR